MSKMTAVAITTPSDEDVVFEKGLKTQRRPGNVYYRQLIKEKANEYNIAETRKLKDMIAMSIFHKISSTRRFLTKLDDGKYYVVSEEAVIVKIKQALRDQKRERVTNPEKKTKGTTKKKGQRKTDASSALNPIPAKREKTIRVDKDMEKVLEICQHLSPKKKDA